MRRILTASALILGIVLAAAIVGFLHDLRAAERRVSAGARTAATRFGPLEYADRGAGQPVLVVHGAAGGFDQGLLMAGPLAARGYRLIAPSRFGYLGSSMPPGADPAMQADAFAALLDRLGIGRTDVVAISAGAWSALAFAARHPERCQRLVLLVPADYLPEGTKIHGGPVAGAVFRSDFAAWTAVRLTPLAPGALSRIMLGVDPKVLAAADPEEKARVDAILQSLAPIGRRRAGMALDIRTAAERRPLDLAAIRCPVLAVSAEDDAFGTAARARLVASQVEDGRTLIFPTGGHALVGRHAAALAAADGFLRRP